MRLPMPHPVIVAAGAGYAVAVTAPDPGRAAAHVAIALPVAVVVGLALRSGWHHRHLAVADDAEDTELPGERATTGPAETHRRRALAVWAALWSTVLYWQLMVFTSNPRDDYPTFSHMLNLLLGSPPTHAAAWAFWLWLGWYAVRR